MEVCQMKKIFTVITILFISIAAFAQEDPRISEGASFIFDGFEKGNYWIWAGFDWDQYGTSKISISTILRAQVTQVTE